MTFNTLSIEDILHEYERTRLLNKRLLQERQEEIYSRIPEIREIDQTAKLSYLRVAKARVMGEDAGKQITHDVSLENRRLTERKQALLKAAGYSADYLEPIYNCQSCHDTGYIDGEKCHCFTKKIIDSLYIQSNLANVLEKENFSTFSLEYYSKEPCSDREFSSYDNMCSVLEKTKSFVKGFEEKSTERGNILIYGETGLGKTFLTNCIAKNLLDNGHTVLYLSASEIFETVLAGYIMNRKQELESLYSYIYSCELLIIDDLGTELTNSFVLSQLFEIINKREIRQSSTLISTNLSMKQLRDRYTERIMSRIIANYTVFNIYGDNIRYQKRKKAINSNT
ncbi:MAG: ATP-binding protein [Wujia sp.]